MKNLTACPAWPALMDLDTAILYFGGKESAVFALVAWGFLVPWSTGRRNTAFLREDLDAALLACRMAGRELTPPDGVNSVERAAEHAATLKAESKNGPRGRVRRASLNSPH